MRSGSATPPAGEPQRPDTPAPSAMRQGADAAGEPPPGEERYGPLRVLRTRKDDGRSLILYSVEPGAAQSGAPVEVRAVHEGASDRAQAST